MRKNHNETEGELLVTTYRRECVPQAKETGKPGILEEQREV